jgi:hypothetical protein
MEQNKGTLQRIAQHLALAVAPLRDAVSDLESFQAFMLRIGWQVDSLPPQYTALAAAVNTALNRLVGLGDGAEAEEVLGVINAVGDVYRGMDAITSAPGGIPPAEVDNFLDELAGAIFELLLVEYLAAAFPAAYNALLTVGVISLENVLPTATRPGFLAVRFHPGEISKVLSEPQRLPERLYGWGTADVDFNRLAQYLLALSVALGLDAYIKRVDAEFGGAFQDDITQTDDPVELMLNIPLLLDNIDGEEVEIGLGLLELPAEGTKPAGLILVPLIPSSLSDTLEIRTNLSLLLRAGSDIANQFGVMFRGDDIEVRFPFSDGAALPEAGFGADLIFAPPEPVVLFGEPGRTRLQLNGASFGLALNAGQRIEFLIQLNVDGLTLIIAAENVDGFLSEMFGDEDLKVEMPLNLTWSSLKGLSLSGGGGLAVSQPTHIEIGPVEINRFDAMITSTVSASAPPDFRAAFAVSIAGRLGPLAFSVDSVGLDLALIFKEGNAGPFDVTTGFKPPDGLGLSIDGGGFTGGGFMRYVEADERYEGMLELEYEDRISLKAIGLLTTRMPGGKPGFSLLILITAEFPPIQLGFGFALLGVGGLLGLNRSVMVERLRSGVRDGTLNSVLFPQDVVANADRILSDLSQVFPTTPGQFVFSPMARIAWGTPKLISIDLGLIIELPNPVRILILGNLRMVLPDEKLSILQLQVNFLGVIDFEAGMLSFDATIFESRLLSFPLSGDMAVRVKWRGEGNILLTVGGFHPLYQPPPLNLPQVRRITLQLLAQDNPRLTLETYFALTSNTIQFGARLELYAGAGSFNIYGFLSFDVLFQFNPFYFIADIGAMLALRHGSSTIASISLSFTLEGPTPWHAHGKATLRICWFLTVTVRFDKTWGEQRNTRLDDIAVLPLLQAALADRGNWQANLPSDKNLLVTVKQIDPAAGLVISPAGVLTISQKVVPLNIDVQKFGTRKPADASRFAIQEVAVGPAGASALLRTVAAKEDFAPAQFFERSDTENLIGKSFEKYEGGVQVEASKEMESDYAARRVVEYELFYKDEQRDLTPRTDPFQVHVLTFEAWALGGAVASSPISHNVRGKPADAPGEVFVRQENYAVVFTRDMTPVPAGGFHPSEAEAKDQFTRLLRQQPSLDGEIQVVPAFEVNRL